MAISMCQASPWFPASRRLSASSTAALAGTSTSAIRTAPPSTRLTHPPRRSTNPALVPHRVSCHTHPSPLEFEWVFCSLHIPCQTTSRMRHSEVGDPCRRTDSCNRLARVPEGVDHRLHASDRSAFKDAKDGVVVLARDRKRIAVLVDGDAQLARQIEFTDLLQLDGELGDGRWCTALSPNRICPTRSAPAPLGLSPACGRLGKLLVISVLRFVGARCVAQQELQSQPIDDRCDEIAQESHGPTTCLRAQARIGCATRRLWAGRGVWTRCGLWIGRSSASLLARRVSRAASSSADMRSPTNAQVLLLVRVSLSRAGAPGVGVGALHWRFPRLLRRRASCVNAAFMPPKRFHRAGTC